MTFILHFKCHVCLRGSHYFFNSWKWLHTVPPSGRFPTDLHGPLFLNNHRELLKDVKQGINIKLLIQKGFSGSSVENGLEVVQRVDRTLPPSLYPTNCGKVRNDDGVNRGSGRCCLQG